MKHCIAVNLKRECQLQMDCASHIPVMAVEGILHSANAYLAAICTNLWYGYAIW